MNIKQKLKKYLLEPRFHFSRFQFNLVAVFFVSVGIVAGTYFTLSEVWPKVFALNDSAKVWTFNSANSGDYTASLSLVNDSGAQPTGGTVGANEFTNPAYDSDNSSWNVAAVPASGWVEVPGDATYSTNNFLVMQYEAKYDCTGDDDGDDATTCSAPADSGAGMDYRDLTFDSANVVSTANGAPIVHITQPQAIAACTGNTHLITNAEWMTIARNAEAQTTNWADGTVGSLVSSGGGMYRGNVGESTSVGYNGSDPEYGSSRDTKARLTLSNGSQLWDLSGNVWEFNSDTIAEADQPDVSGQSGYAWREFTDLTSYGSLSYDLVRPAGTTYNANHGVGRIYHNSESVSTSERVFLRGGDWSNTSNAGAFALSLYNNTGSQNYNIGFRCASDPVAISQSYSSSSGREAAGGNTISVGSIADGKIYQSVDVGDTSTYDFSVYVYDTTTGNDGGTVDSSIAELYYNGSTITTTYTSVGSGWWKLSGTLTGANESREYGVQVKSGKTVKVDDFTLSKQGEYSVYTTTAYSNALLATWDTFCEGTLSGSTCTEDATYGGNSAINYQICTDDGSTCESGGSWKYWDGANWQTASNTTTHVNTAAELTQTAMQALPIVSQKISVKAIFTFGGNDVPYLPHISIGLTTDTTAPDTNASALAMTRSNGGTSVTSNGWTNNSNPYFSWTAGADNSGGSGLKGYCLYLGTDTAGDSATSKGLLGTSPVSTDGTTCQFIISSTSIDFATSSYKGGTWLSTSSSPYYLNIKAIDNSGNIFGGSSAQFQFRFDNTAPTNTSYISCASGSFSNVADMNFSWPTSGGVASSDDNAGILGWQYQINSTAGTWLGTTTESTLGVNNYMPTSESSRTLTQDQDGSSIVSGNNIVYFRTVDSAGNTSSSSTYRTCNLSYGGAAPAFDGLDTVTITPATSTSNSYALSWPAATPTSGQSVAHYYYMINTAPPSTLATLQGNSATYIDNGTSTTVSADALPNVNKGSNTIYVVAIDDADTPNYSPSNYITGTFTLNSTDPDNVENLVASDSSIKSQSQWNVTLTWTAPDYQGAGNLTYLVYRSTDGSSFSQVGSTTGLSYVDNTPTSEQYYYKIHTQDGADAQSSGTNAVTITPTGKWTTAPSLDSGPDVGSITTKKATITWSTSRTSDSKVQYGTSSGSYGDVEPSNSSQVSSHSIQLTGLNPGTTYYYKAKWTDEDGNTGTSEEKSFTTAPAPSVKEVEAKSIGLSSAIIEFTSKDASRVKIYYGTSTNFGGVKEISTSTSETTYTAQLTDLLDGTKYYYKINTFDSENEEYAGDTYSFTTLPRPRISNVRIQQVANTAQSTILVTWSTNTDVSSIVTYYPEGNSSDARDEVNVALTKGSHKMIVRGLAPQTNYNLIVKGRDKIGNEASSDIQRLTTATDTRPPQISELNVEGSTVPPTASTAQESTAQLIVSWNTDEPSTSQVEFGEGTGTNYSSKTQEDSNLTYNHLVIISGLTPSKVYHLRAISKDKAGNIGNSIDTVTITPKTTENALNLVITNLQEAFGFLGKLRE
ncbi:MAG: fibronectin type III domain-containing protein [Pseudomonadales bacterium]|nr:fibronectin type III domain-containing protein [Pseudomonadales bacterium]